MISFVNVSKFFNPGGFALRNISFNVAEKEFVSIVGKSGSGKTTLLKLILAEEKPDEGEVFFRGQNVHKIKKGKLPFYRRKIGAVFQDYKLFPSKTTYENIAYILEVIGAPENQIERDVKEVLEIVGLEDKAESFPVQLSGGEKQRVAIARALIHRPEVILADEPTGNLDPYNTAEIIKLLLRINEMGTTVVLSTHNKDIVNKIKKRVITLENGRIVRDMEKGRFVI
jgi:cell division transport system ATP-binding protein